MIHAMLDLETWGLAPGCAIRSVGAVAFDPTSGYISEETFYANVSAQSCLDARLTIDPETAKWWAEQSAGARAALDGDQRSFGDVAHDFSLWYARPGAAAVWSHGLTFDVPVWEAACRAIGLRAPWGYRDGRDTRTLFALVPEFRHDSIPFEGEKHNALDDARHQARLVQRAWRMLRGG